MKAKKTDLPLTEKDCAEMLKEARWKDCVFCPYCKSKEVIRNGWDDSGCIRLERYMCKHCGKTFNVKTKTIFENSKVPLQKWFMMIALLGTNSILFLSELLNVAYSTAYYMAKKIRSVISEEERTLYENIKLKIQKGEKLKILI